MTNLLGIHSLVFSGGTRPSDIATIVNGANDAGFDIVEFTLQDSHHFEAQSVRSQLIEHGMGAVCSRGLRADADISSRDPAIVRQGARLLHESIQATASIGGSRLTGALYSAFGKAPGPLTAAGRRNIVSVLREAAADAAEAHVKLGLEVCNRYETNVVNSAKDALELIDDVGSDNVDLHLDTYHMNIEEDDFVAPVLAAGDRLGYVHIGENHRGYLGSGHIDFAAFFDALHTIDYQGPIAFEAFSTAVVSATLSTELAIWRDLWEDSASLATSAHEFITQHLAAATAA